MGSADTATLAAQRFLAQTLMITEQAPGQQRSIVIAPQRMPTTSQALTMAASLLQSRWLMYEQSTSPIPFPMLMILVLWLTIIFVSFGLFAPFNGTVVSSLLVSALAVSGAIFLILEMYEPYAGLIQISSAPLPADLPDADELWRATETAWARAVPAVPGVIGSRDATHACAVLTGMTSAR